MPKCGDKGHLTKSGTPCGYNITETDTGCPHHDGSGRAKEFQQRGGLLANIKDLPGWMEPNDFQTLGDVKRTLAAMFREVATNKRADVRRVDVLTKICNSACNVLQLEKMDELTDVLRTVEGQGKAVIVFNDMKRARRQAIPAPRELAS